VNVSQPEHRPRRWRASVFGVHFPGGEQPDFHEGRTRIEQRVYAFPRRHFSPGVMFFYGLLASSQAHMLFPRMQHTQQILHGVFVDKGGFVDTGGSCILHGIFHLWNVVENTPPPVERQTAVRCTA
jgi:hypothetical protein